MKKSLLVLSLGLFIFGSYGDNCARPQNTFDSLYCARKIFFSLDDDLNKTYQQLKKTLDTRGKQLLKRGQLDWIAERNRECVNGDAVYVSCAVEKTRQRLYFLKDRLHECQSVGCLNDEL